MKRVFSILLATALLCGLLASCGGEEKKEIPKDEAYDGYIESILTDWMNYISTNEGMYDDLDWAASYIQQFIDKPEWDALLMARAALELTAERIKLREDPEWLAAEDAYDYFMEREKDLSFVQPELESFGYNRESMLTSCELFRSYLESEVFLTEGLSRVVEEIEIKREEINIKLQYLSLSTEYLLVELDDTEWTEKVHTAMKDACPRIDAARDASLTEKKQLEAAASDVVDDLSGLTSRLATLVGEGRTESDLLDEYIQQGDDASIAAMRSEIEDLPVLIPTPAWILTFGRYYWTNEDGTRRYLTKKEELTSPPENCVLEYEDATEDEVMDYIYLLHMILGLDGRWVDREDSFYDVYFQAGDSVFTVSWTENGARIYMLENLVCLAPDWFIPD